MLGYLLATLSAGLGSAKDIVSKKLSFNLTGVESGFASFAFALPFYVVVYGVFLLLGWENVPFGLTFWTLVILRALTDSAAETLKMASFVHGDISTVAAFFAMSPLFLLVLSPLITKDVPTLVGSIGVLIAVIGSLLMVLGGQREQAKKQKKGIFLALLAALFFSLNSCFDRLAVLEAGPVSSGFAMTAVSALILLPWVSFKKPWWRGQAGALALRGSFEVSFMVAKLAALQYLQAPYVASFQKLALLISIIAGGTMFKEKNLKQKFLGACFIATGGILIVVGG